MVDDFENPGSVLLGVIVGDFVQFWVNSEMLH
jgi:hypothetical protein